MATLPVDVTHLYPKVNVQDQLTKWLYGLVCTCQETTHSKYYIYLGAKMDLGPFLLHIYF